ncbi:MAG: arginine repressor [Candidatus Cryptobacteroides sp.]
MKGKHERHSLIKQIVKEHRVANQEELSSLLERHGFSVAQATLSRDIRELHITKEHEEDGYCYRLQSPHKVSGDSGIRTSGSILGLEISGNMAVVKTRSGHAAMVASVIDEADFPQVMGTIAGDDTVFLVLRDPSGAEAFRASFASVLGLSGNRHK